MTTSICSFSQEGFKIGDAIVSLPKMQLALLRILAIDSYEIVRMSQICTGLQNAGFTGTKPNVQNAISLLRANLCRYGAVEWIVTIPKTGYLFKPFSVSVERGATAAGHSHVRVISVDPQTACRTGALAVTPLTLQEKHPGSRHGKFRNELGHSVECSHEERKRPGAGGAFGNRNSVRQRIFAAVDR